MERINLRQVKRAQGRPKKTWMEVIRQDIEAKDLSEGILLDRNNYTAYYKKKNDGKTQLRRPM